MLHFFKLVYLHCMKFILILIFSLPIFGFSQVELVWVDSIDADFSFTEDWDYEEGIYVNQWGQLSCDGFCPRAADAMKDDHGRIFDDSLAAFYAIIDTTHRYFTHESTARVYSYGESHYVTLEERGGRLFLRTEMNMMAQSSLHLEINLNADGAEQFDAYLIYYSLSDQPPRKFALVSGSIEISNLAYNNGMVKLEFDLEFESEKWDTEGLQTWNGKVLVEIPSK